MRRAFGLDEPHGEGDAQALLDPRRIPHGFAQVRRISWVRGVGRSDVVSGLLVQPRSGRPLLVSAILDSGAGRCFYELGASLQISSGAHGRLVMRAVIPTILAFAVIALPGQVAAKPKKIVSNGCTAQQIQSPAASPCIDQMERDVMAGSSIIHAVYCSSSGAILCCQYEGNRVVDHSCTVVGKTRPAIGVTGPRPMTAAPRTQ